MAKILIHCQHGAEDAERATLPFVFGNTALIAGQEAAIMLTIEAVRLVTPGGADGVEHPAAAPLRELIPEFIAGGGKVWACQACTKPRGITEVIEGAEIVGAATVVEYLANGAQSLTF
jgi:predicted peroxiredoxin